MYQDKEKRIEDNSKLAKFIGGKPVNPVPGHPIAFQFSFEFGHQESWDEGGFLGSGPSDCWDVEKLQFHSSWDWLMLVIDRIERLGYHTHIEYFGEHRVYFSHDNVGLRRSSKIATAYDACLQFVDWYNTFGHLQSGYNNNYNSDGMFLSDSAG